MSAAQSISTSSSTSSSPSSSTSSTTAQPVRIAIYGDGWRTRFFCRVAAAIPDRLQVALVIGKHSDNLARIAAEYAVPTTTDPDALSTVTVDYVCVVVSWPQTPVLTERLVKQGYYVLAETPPAPDLPGLRALWEAVSDRADHIQIGEQYYRMPGHAARLGLVHNGLLGRVNGVHIASTHLYHAVALMRDYLGVGRIATTVNARQFDTPIFNPMNPDGWIPNPQVEERPTTLATLDFGEGRYGLYDFVDNQWWNPLLSRRLIVRGELGEMVDDSVTRWVSQDEAPVTTQIEYRRSGRDMNLEGNDVLTASFDSRVIYRNPFVGSRLSEDDLAVADHLVAMGQYVRGERPEVYSLADGIHDHALGLAIEESARTRADVRVSGEAWMQ